MRISGRNFFVLDQVSDLLFAEVARRVSTWGRSARIKSGADSGVDGGIAGAHVRETAALMASDGRCTERPTFEGFALSLTVPDEISAERLFTALADGGKVQMPLTKTFFSPRFGMVDDRFGVSWIGHVAPEGERKN